MEAGSPSLTAQGAAILRAAHQLLDRPPILDDPIALRIIGAEDEAALRSNPQRFDRSRSLRAFLALRSRYAEDGLAGAIARGVRQYVILGAGLDTFPYRNPYQSTGLRVFEVDHPATQAWKRRRLQEAGIVTPDSLTFAPVDFEKQTLTEGLSRAGFQTGQPAFFSWLGVVIYLTRPAVINTLEFVAALPAGSGIVFDYSPPTGLMDEDQRSGHERLGRQVAAQGEPWLTYFVPASLAETLRRLGIKRLEDLGPEEAEQRYFRDRSDGLHLGGAGRLMKAEG
ncbi:MAG: class I SAM-dependent methyltransferase [Deltaproteobacteria bacterium]|nr:class I SAM-dependent methyltransferase [Deltaproteobacteria bacterium]